MTYLSLQFLSHAEKNSVVLQWNMCLLPSAIIIHHQPPPANLISFTLHGSPFNFLKHVLAEKFLRIVTTERIDSSIRTEPLIINQGSVNYHRTS